MNARALFLGRGDVAIGWGRIKVSPDVAHVALRFGRGLRVQQAMREARKRGEAGLKWKIPHLTTRT